MDTGSFERHWQWLMPLFGAIMAWLGKRRGPRLWHAIVRQFRLNRENESLRQDLADSERSRVRLREALQQLTQVAEVIETATIPTTNSLPAPNTSPDGYGTFSPRQASPPATRSKSSRIGTGRRETDDP